MCVCVCGCVCDASSKFPDAWLQQCVCGHRHYFSAGLTAALTSVFGVFALFLYLADRGRRESRVHASWVIS